HPAAGRRLEAQGRHLPHGAGQQGLRPLPLVDPASARPLLAVDIDGVVSLFGFEERPQGPLYAYQLVDGVPHCISLAAGDRLRRLAEAFELVWASGWEEKANFYLPPLLGLPELP